MEHCSNERRAARSGCGEPRWHGHRTFFVDGSGFSMPDTPELQNHFGQPGQQRRGCGFPQAHLLAMFDAASGLLVKMLAAPLRTHDQSQVAQLHPELAAGDVLVADRGFASYVHLALIVGRNLHAVFRAHQRQLVSFRRDRRLSGQQARAPSPAVPTAAWCASSVASINWSSTPSRRGAPTGWTWRSSPLCRKDPWSASCVTGPAFAAFVPTRSRWSPRCSMPRSIRRRSWPRSIAAAGKSKPTSRISRRRCGMDVLRCQSVPGVLKELTMFALVYNLVRLVMLRPLHVRWRVPVEQISFVDALRWLDQASQGTPPLAVRVNRLRR